MSDKLPAVEKMIEKVQKKKDLSRNAAIDYMLAVATGRLAALWRYDESLPEGKTSKGILAISGRKKRAPKSPKIMPKVSESAAPEPKQRATNKRKPKNHKPKNTEGKKIKTKKGVAKAKQLPIEEVAQEAVAAE